MEIGHGRKAGTISVSQGDYVRTILHRYDMENCNPSSTPGSGPEIQLDQPGDKLLKGARIKEYEELVGALQYLAHVTRFDICYAVNQLARACSRPSSLHMGAAKRVLLYIKKAVRTLQSPKEKENNYWWDIELSLIHI